MISVSSFELFGNGLLKILSVDHSVSISVKLIEVAWET